MLRGLILLDMYVTDADIANSLRQVLTVSRRPLGAGSQRRPGLSRSV